MLLESKYDIGELVYLKTDKDQNKRMVLEVLFSTNGVQYRLACGNCSSWHYEMECTIEKDVLQTTTN